MQNHPLQIVLKHLEETFHCDRGEMRGLLSLLHRALTGATPILSGSDADAVYHCAHRLHSELHSCGYERLSDLAMSVELQARAGRIDRAMIDELLLRSASLSREIEAWLVEN